MYRAYDKDGKSTPWFSEPPTKSQLEKCTIDQLVILAKRKKGFKNVLKQFLFEN